MTGEGQPVLEPAVDPAERLPRRLRWRTRLWMGAALMAYGVMGLAANWPTLPGDSDDMRAGDMTQMAWFLTWTPHALAHGHNPFFTTALNYPAGVNLAQNTSAPLLGLVAAPLTLAVNPVASLNLLLWLAFPLSAGAMYVALRRLGMWTPSAFLGGALYGFSPHVVNQSFNHLNLTFVPLPPLMLLALYETLRPGGTRPLRWGIVLAVVCTAQFFISPEIAATTALTGLLAAVVLAIAHPRQVVPTLRHCAPAVGVAAAIMAAFVAYPAWFMLHGPHRYDGPAYGAGPGADLLATVVPTTNLRFHPAAATARGSALADGNVPENGSYLGVVLLVLLLMIVVACWSTRWVRPAAVMVLLLTVLSYGSPVKVDNEVTGFTIPFAKLGEVPLLDNVLLIRLSLQVSIFAALLLAAGTTAVWQRLRTRHGVGVGVGARRGRAALAAATAVLVVASAVTLVPRWPFETDPTHVPGYFTSSAVEQIPQDSVVLITPYPSVSDLRPQLWQATSGIRFNMLGGYVLTPDAQGHPTNYPAVLRPSQVETYLTAMSTGGEGFPEGPVPAQTQRLVCDFQTFLLAHDITTVLAVPGAVAHAPELHRLYARALGPPSESVGGVEAWYGIARGSDWCGG